MDLLAPALPLPSTPAPATPHAGVPDDDAEKISAYYSLVFPDYTYYLQTLNVTIGRRCPAGPSSSTADAATVDVDLGALKSVSRLHARIEYDEDQERFVLIVVGRNGAWVDGIWSGSGSRVPLGERSQIQIASRTFHFVLPPPPAPEDSPSPSSGSSGQLRRSPSVDITSMSSPLSEPAVSPPPPSASTPPANTKHPPAPPHASTTITTATVKGKTKDNHPTAVPTKSTTSGKGKGKAPAANKKKRKAPPEPDRASSPSSSFVKVEDGSNEPEKEKEPAGPPPPKPTLTYSQLCYRAIKSHGGKATLHEICAWVMDHFEWYRLNRGTPWESSIRHNLSSSRAFKKLERVAGEAGRGKAFLWAVDENFEHTLAQQEARYATSQAPQPPPQPKKKQPTTAERKKVENKPSPFTSRPLEFRKEGSASGAATPSAEQEQGHGRGHGQQEPPGVHQQPTFIVQPQAPMVAQAASAVAPPPPPRPISTAPKSQAVGGPSAQNPNPTPTPGGMPRLPPDLRVPIVVGPLPPSYVPPPAPAGSQTPAPIVLHDNTLFLNPAIFASLSAEQLKALEALGAAKALEILQGYIKRYMDEKRRAARGGARGRGRKVGRGRGGAVGGQQQQGTGPGQAHRGQGEMQVDSQEQQGRKNDAAVGAGGGQRAPSPVIVIDDDDDEAPAPDEGPVAKRRRVEGGTQA